MASETERPWRLPNCIGATRGDPNLASGTEMAAETDLLSVLEKEKGQVFLGWRVDLDEPLLVSRSLKGQTTTVFNQRHQGQHLCHEVI